jgi:hypothetical protein
MVAANSSFVCTVRVFGRKFTLEDAIGSHACSLQANMRVTNGISLGSSLLLPVHTVICVQTLKVHAGAIQTVICMVAQYYCGKSIETQAGFLRTLLIYFIAGIGGNLVSAIFSPRSLAAGSDPAVYGLLGVMLSELLQAWQVVPSKWWHLAKLMTAITVSMLIGTLPYVDNWSHLGGLVFGIISGVVFLPYITFGKWDARRKKLLLYICVPLLMFLLLMALLTFYKLSSTDNICVCCSSFYVSFCLCPRV